MAALATSHWYPSRLKVAASLISPLSLRFSVCFFRLLLLGTAPFRTLQVEVVDKAVEGHEGDAVTHTHTPDEETVSGRKRSTVAIWIEDEIRCGTGLHSCVGSASKT